MAVSGDLSLSNPPYPTDNIFSFAELNFQSTNNFFRQIRNLVFDITDVPGSAAGLHWPSSQATVVQNCVFKMATGVDLEHTGIFMEEGSGGLMADLVFYGGKYGAQFGNQQFTMRNLSFYGSDTAIQQIWNWGWTYKSLNIVNCRVGIDMSSTDIGSVTLLDSTFSNVEKAIVTSRAPGNATGLGSLVIENVEYKNVPTVLEGADGQPILLGDANGVVYDTGYAMASVHHTLSDTSC
jgi:glucan 1,3-beta-glucosidase